MTDWIRHAFIACQECDTPMAHAFRKAFGIVGHGPTHTGGIIVPEKEWRPERELLECFSQRLGALDRRG